MDCWALREEPGLVIQWLTDVYRDQTPVTSWEMDFYHCHRKLLHLYHEEHVGNTVLKTTGFPVSNF